MADISDNGSFNAALANIESANYGPTAITSQANTAANTQNTQQATQAQAMQNQLMAARMPLILSRLHGMTAAQAADDQSGVPAQSKGSAPATPPEKLQEAEDNSGAADPSILNPEAISAAMRAKYFVPAVPPGAMDAINNAYAADPEDKYGMGPKSVMTRIDLWKQQRTQASQMQARDDFDALSAVTDAPEGQAMSVLERSHPETYAAIQKQFAKDPDAERDEEDQARLFAAHAAGELHQYTGRAAKEDKAGVYRDEATGIPIPGVEKVGLSSEQYVKLAHEALAPTTVPDGNGGTIQVPMWQAAKMLGAQNINSPGDWVMVNASRAGLPGASSTLSANSAPKQEAHKVAQAAIDKATQQSATPPPPVNGAPAPVNGVGTARNAQGNVDPQLTTALQDTDYDYKPTLNGSPYVPKVGATPPPAVLDDMNKQTAARNDLAKTSSQGVGAASAALTFYKAAQDVLAKGNYDGGAWNAELAKYSKWLPAGWQSHMTGDYQEVVKYLGNAALQSGKGIFSKMTEKESDQVQHDLNPSAATDPTALREMIARGAMTAQYAIDSAKRVPAYLAARKDANQFPSWNQKHFPMEDATKPAPASDKFVVGKRYTDKNGNSKTYKGNGQWQ
jgi:hypothetical protein